ncbi:hypothetical protein HN371_13675 [Candidatus Poribacteria bacterium]|nr:hypothetical protein [Candidatus Poribacteria bacterium]MBT5534662.1 hypothetical protein [Candidatus Poribacteria bacterium]MBT5713345.1 hypothetical protein [Candidatus Poribacteria bacterium]MBT7095987.1 hypothetical protein [Candidatus Poribacteria bacterium]
MLRRFLVVVCLITAASSPAFAVIGVSPLKLDVYARPGTPEPFYITISNTTASQRVVRLVVAALGIDEAGNTHIIEEGADGPGSDDAEGEGAFAVQTTARQDEAQQIVSFEGGPVLTLAPKEEREVTCLATLPPGSLTEHLAWIVADPGPEEMPLYGNTNMRLAVTFRIAAQVLIVPGVKRRTTDADGNATVTLERMLRPNYAVSVSDVQEIVPEVGVERGVLRVEGILNNRSNTYITPLIQARLRNMTLRRTVEEIVLTHGISFVMGGMTRRFGGDFMSSLDPGEYEITVAVDLGDGRPPTRSTHKFELTTAVEGQAGASQAVLTVLPVNATVNIRPGERSSGEATVTNNYDETLRVMPDGGSGVYADWFTFSPKSLVLHPGRSRTVRIAIHAPGDAAQDVGEVPVLFVPTTVNGLTFPETDAPRMNVTLRVLPPPVSSTPRDR